MIATAAVYWIVIVRAVFCVVVTAVSVRMLWMALTDQRVMKTRGINGMVARIVQGHITDGWYLTVALGLFAISSGLSWWAMSFRDRVFTWRHVLSAVLLSIVPGLLGAMKLSRFARYRGLVEHAIEMEQAIARQARQDQALAEVAAQHHADMQDIGRKIAENTELTAEGVEKAKDAYHEANSVNVKIEKTNIQVERIASAVLAHQQAAAETQKTDHAIAQDTNETAHAIDSKVPPTS